MKKLIVFSCFSFLLTTHTLSAQTPDSVFKGLTFLRSISNGEAHFNLITYWENLEVIKNFAGEDFEKAKYYPEDDNFLLEFEEKVKHHEVFAHLQ